MLSSKALEAATDEIAVYVKKEARAEMARAVVTAYLTASMPEDVKGLVEELRALNEEDFYQYPASTYRKVNDAAAALASLSAKVGEVTRELYLTRNQRDNLKENMDRLEDEVTDLADSLAPVEALRKEGHDRLKIAEASLAERDRIIAEKDKALEAVRTPLTAMKFYTEACHDSPVSLQSHMNDGLPHVIEALAIIDAARAARDRRAS